jgi:hypothetical protein
MDRVGRRVLSIMICMGRRSRFGNLDTKGGGKGGELGETS